jgi:hypothetical protein
VAKTGQAGRAGLEAGERGACQRLRPARPVRGLAGAAHAEAQEGARGQDVERDVAVAAGQERLLAEAGNRGQGGAGLRFAAVAFAVTVTVAVTFAIGALASLLLGDLRVPEMERALPALPQLAPGRRAAAGAGQGEAHGARERIDAEEALRAGDRRGGVARPGGISRARGDRLLERPALHPLDVGRGQESAGAGRRSGGAGDRGGGDAGEDEKRKDGAEGRAAGGARPGHGRGLPASEPLRGLPGHRRLEKGMPWGASIPASEETRTVPQPCPFIYKSKLVDISGCKGVTFAPLHSPAWIEERAGLLPAPSARKGARHARPAAAAADPRTGTASVFESRRQRAASWPPFRADRVLARHDGLLTSAARAYPAGLVRVDTSDFGAAKLVQTLTKAEAAQTLGSLTSLGPLASELKDVTVSELLATAMKDLAVKRKVSVAGIALLRERVLSLLAAQRQA